MSATDPLAALLDPARLTGLLKRCAHQDEDALAALYRLTGPVLHAVARRELGSVAAADAVLVQVFVAVWEHAVGPDRGWVWLWDRLDRAVDHQRSGRAATPTHAPPDVRGAASPPAGRAPRTGTGSG